ncbi:MAG: hypothetical protein ACPL0B_00900 [Anaerolineales bacterium]
MELDKDNWERLFNAEIEQAFAARSIGKEGMARVCARRAANILIQQYFNLCNIPSTKNAMKNLTFLQSYLNPSHPAQPLISNLIRRVDENFTLPNDIDLIRDVLKLKELLL